MSDPETDPPPPEEAPDKGARRAGRVVRRLLIFFCIVVVLTGGGAFGLFQWAQTEYRAPGPLADRTVVVIEPGSGLQRIARELAEAGILARPEVFIAMLRYTGEYRDLKAGEYAFDAAISPEDVTRKLVDNDVLSHAVTVPEGLTVYEIFDLLRQNADLTGDLPEPATEGSLLPETYHFNRGESRADIVRRMELAMQGALAELWENRAAGLPFSSPEEALVLASIVEKETGVASERPHIAGVFVNRLKKGMRLQSDPTVVYALTGGQGPLGRELTRQDWKVDDPYNTYQNTGLPPGPIANPGRDAIAAAMNPMQTKDLYFVADGTGGHAFAETLKQHNRNVAAWRKAKSSGN